MVLELVFGMMVMKACVIHILELLLCDFSVENMWSTLLSLECYFVFYFFPWGSVSFESLLCFTCEMTDRLCKLLGISVFEVGGGERGGWGLVLFFCDTETCVL